MDHLCLSRRLGHESNFEKASREITDAFGVGYDYGSVMHYSAYAFSKNGEPTIVPKVSRVFHLDHLFILYISI